MKTSTSLKAVVAAVALAASAYVSTASASLIVLPGDFGVANGTIVTNEYASTGLIFDSAEVFDDPPLAWGGLPLNLVSAVTGHFLGTTDFLSAEAGFVGGPSDLLLEVFDGSNALIGSTIADDGIGPHGRLLMTLNVSGIASFRISTPTSDSYGVNQLEFNDPTQAVPEPATLALLGFGLAGLGFSRRKR